MGLTGGPRDILGIIKSPCEMVESGDGVRQPRLCVRHSWELWGGEREEASTRGSRHQLLMEVT